MKASNSKKTKDIKRQKSNKISKNKKPSLFKRVIKKALFWKLMIPIFILLTFFGGYILVRVTFLTDVTGFILTTEKESAGTVVFEMANRLSKITMLEVIDRSVFPYDYIDTDFDRVEADALARKGELFDKEMEFQYRVDKFCRKERIHYERGGEFVVISARVRLGYQFPKELEKMVKIDREKNSITFRLPSPSILDIVYEDYCSKNYNYPDIGIDPSAYKKIIYFVEERMDLDNLLEHYKKDVEDEYKAKLKLLVKGCGYSKVDFKSIEEK